MNVRVSGWSSVDARTDKEVDNKDDDMTRYLNRSENSAAAGGLRIPF